MGWSNQREVTCNQPIRDKNTFESRKSTNEAAVTVLNFPHFSTELNYFKLRSADGVSPLGLNPIHRVEDISSSFLKYSIDTVMLLPRQNTGQTKQYIL